MEELTCKTVRRLLWDYTADALAHGERESLEAHVRDCRECVLHRTEVRSVRSGLRSLPSKNLSPLLMTKLQVIASRERARYMRRRNFAARSAEIWSRIRLSFDNLLRPLAVPAAGGILASFFCFSIIVDNLHVHQDWRDDIPVGLYTQVTMGDISPFACIGNDIMVQLTIDENGKVTDFSPLGKTTPEQMQEIGNLVLYSTFTPATSFGQRVSGKILVDIHHINVRG